MFKNNTQNNRKDGEIGVSRMFHENGRSSDPINN